MDADKLQRMSDLTEGFIANTLSEQEKQELFQLQKEWLAEKSPEEINILRMLN